MTSEHNCCLSILLYLLTIWIWIPWLLIINLYRAPLYLFIYINYLCRTRRWLSAFLFTAFYPLNAAAYFGIGFLYASFALPIAVGKSGLRVALQDISKSTCWSFRDEGSPDYRYYKMEEKKAWYGLDMVCYFLTLWIWIPFLFFYNLYEGPLLFCQTGTRYCKKGPCWAAFFFIFFSPVLLMFYIMNGFFVGAFCALPDAVCRDGFIEGVKNKLNWTATNYYRSKRSFQGNAPLLLFVV
jgi:hypothetical protein